MIKQMTPRERTLAIIVGLGLFAFVNLFLVKFLGGFHRQFRSDLAAKSIEVETMRSLLAEREMWLQRDQWLQTRMPKLENRDRAAAELRKLVTEIAGKHNIPLEKANLGSPETRAQYALVALSFETKSKWKDLAAFLRELQKPDAFIVVESAKLNIDETDKTQMRGRFRVAKWFSTN